ncbi:MAG: translocation/assembly module TamB domain-containing protein [Aphanocapsa sp. GSE-SYN-MK-11-07L]|nr:translocation/assembly module TamB domain-containing protein [Aphanocapsa sp. GSE-SYN-MK-11-07L]
MANSPGSSEPPTGSRRLSLFLLSRPVIGTLLALLAVTAGASWRLWVYLNNELAPSLSDSFSKTLDRPVQVGKVERVTLSSIEFGESAIPAVAGQIKGESDRSSAKVSGVVAGFNVWDLIFSRTLNLDLTLKQPKLYAAQAADGQWFKAKFIPQPPGALQTNLRTVRFQEAEAEIVPFGAAPQTLQNVGGRLDLTGQAERVSFDLKGGVAVGGNFNLQGEWQRLDQRLNASLRTRQLSAQLFNSVLTSAQVSPTGGRGRTGSSPVRITSGAIDSNFKLRLRPNQTPEIDGSAELSNLGAKVAALGQPLRNFRGRLSVQNSTATLEGVRGLIGSVPLRMRGTVDLERGYNLTATLPTVDLAPTLKDFKLKLPVPVSGRVQVEDIRITGAIAQPQLTGTLLSQGPVQVDRIALRQVFGRFRANASQAQVTALRALPAVGGVISGQGRYTFGGPVVANLTATEVPAAAIARLYGNQPTVQLGNLAAQVQVSGLVNNLKAAAQFQAPQAVYPTTGNLLLSNGQILLQNVISQVEDGIVRSNGVIEQGRWQLTALTDGVALRPFNPELRGRLKGQITLLGKLADVSPEQVRAAGNLTFTEGIANLRTPLTAQVAWDGKKIRVQEAVAEGLVASGFIFARFRPQPAITGLDLQVAAKDYALQALGLDLPSNIAVQGRADFQGRLTGTPTAANLVGNLQTYGLAINDYAFAPTLTGSLDYGMQRGVKLQLAGGSDRISLDVGASFRPRSFAVIRDQSKIIGRTEGDLLRVNVEQFPLLALNIRPPQPNVGPVSGIADGTFTVDLDRQSLIGSLTVTRPGISNVIGDRLAANVSFANGIASISNGELLKGDGRYLFSARTSLGDNPQYTAQFIAENGRLEDVADIVTALSGTPPGQAGPVYGTAADVRPVAVGEPNAPLINQIRRLSEIQVILAQEFDRQQKLRPLPGIEDLSGTFTGRADIAGSVQAGASGRFDFKSERATWGRYKIQRLIASGNLNRGVLNLNPFSLQFADGQATFVGSLGEQQARGNLIVQNFPLEAIQQFLALPSIDVGGKLNGNATLTGSLANPQLQGELSLANATLNQKPLQSAIASFNYSNARLAFNGRAVLQDPEPLLVTGSLPYKLPFATKEPTDNRLQLVMQVKDEGLSLINLFTDQVAWVSGQGAMNLSVTGTLDQPTIDGLVTLQNATLSSQALGESLTGVTGSLGFNGDRLRVEGLSGNLGNGQVLAAGVLPLAQPLATSDPDSQTPFTVGFNQTQLTLDNVYRGGVSGNLILIGTALKPDLTGTIQLSNGQILLPSDEEAETASTESAVGTAIGSAQELSRPNIGFQNLQLVLAENVQVIRPPVIRFLTAGKLTINGTLDNLQPEGEVAFRDGQINLFTSRFRLAPGKTNVARFTPTQGLDPELDLNLITTVTEVSSGRTNRLNEFEAISATSLGSLTSVRVSARVTGRASQLESNFKNGVELSSIPSRSDEEILALLGGGFTLGQSQQDASLVLANIAGSAFLNNFQSMIDNVLNNRVNFRLFPALIPTNRNRPNLSNGSVLGLGAEVGFDITERFSISAMQILTAPQEPTQFNLGYQLTDQLRLTTSVDVTGEAVGLLEFRLRF